MFEDIISSIRKIHGREDFIPLHEPIFQGNEKEYVLETIDSTFVSSVGKFVDRFEEMMAAYTGAKYAVACVNGTSALHAALLGAGVGAEDEVIIQPLTFIATANAVAYCGAFPVFVDVDMDTLGMSPTSLKGFLEHHAVIKKEGTYNKVTGRRIAAVVPMHTYGFACRIEEILEVCNDYKLPLVEDSAESIGTFVGNQHSGTFGKLGIFSFNGNKTITSGGGGAIVTDDEKLAKHLKHLTTTAKIPHRWEYRHDIIGYNYRMPNINAALACAQMEQLDNILEKKRILSQKYDDLFSGTDIKFVKERPGTRANFWLCTILLPNQDKRDLFLEESNDAGVMTRPAWELVNESLVYFQSYRINLEISYALANNLINIPSACSI